MPRETIKKEFNGYSVTVTRGARREMSRVKLLKQNLIDGLSNDDDILVSDVDDYALLAVFAELDKPLTTIDDVAFELPDYSAPIEEHQKAFDLWMETEPWQIEPIIDLINQVNGPNGHRHLLPESELSPEELADPNSSASAPSDSSS